MKERKIMLIHSRLYRKYYPVERSIDIHEISEKDRATLVKWIRHFHNEIRYYNAEIEHNRRKIGNNNAFCFIVCPSDSFDTAKMYYGVLADKVMNLNALSSQDISDLNDVIYAHKYNELLRTFISGCRLPVKNFIRNQVPEKVDRITRIELDRETMMIYKAKELKKELEE